MECMQNSVSPSVMHFESNLILLFIIIKRQFRGFRDSDKRTLKGYFSSTWLGGACTGGGGGGMEDVPQCKMFDSRNTARYLKTVP